MAAPQRDPGNANMNKTRLAILAFTAIAAVAQAADTSPRARAVLDVAEGKSAAAVITVPYEQALDAALHLSGTEGKRFTAKGLRYTPVSRSYGSGETLGIVTLGAPGPEAQRLLAALRSQRTVVAGR